MFITKGQNNEDVLNMNRTLIVQYLQRNGICTRAHLSKVMGLTQASISKTISNLLENGIVYETGIIAGEKGRRSIGISLNVNINKVIGVKISRRNFSVGVFDISGQPFDVHSEMLADDTHLTDILDRIKVLIRSYLDRFNDIAAIGIAVPGPYNQNEGKILMMTEMKDWESVSLKEEFSGIFEVPVIIKHDANSGALAEWWFGSQLKQRNGTLIHFLVGEGVGAGIIVNGSVLSGDQGIAGEIGHISVDVNGDRCACGNYGCLEMYCSSIAFVKYAHEKLKLDKKSILNNYNSLTAADIFKAAGKDDLLAIELVKRAGRYIGYGVVNLINAYDPTTVIISNEMAQGGKLLLDEVKAVVKERILDSIYQNINIELTSFQNDPILYGAAAVAIDYCLKRPGSLAEKNN